MTDTVQVPREATLSAVLDEFERRTKAIPVGHEIASRGASTYNWRICHLDELREIAAAPQATDPRDGEISDLRAYALELQRALTGLTLGGSEFFVRHGEDFRADIRACVARVNEIRASAHDRLLEAVRERKAAESRIATLTAERDAALKALTPFAIMGKLIDRYFPARLDTEMFHSGGAWTDNGVKRTLTLGDFRRARSLTTQPSKTETRDDE